MIGYKILQRQNHKLKTLFHKRRVKIKPRTWYAAEQKMVADGKKGKPYLSGFHFLSSYEVAEAYLKRFKRQDDKVIVKCYAMNVRPKNNKVMLAEFIYFPELPENQ